MAEVCTAQAAPCPDCGTQWGPSLLACPVCHRLVHATRLAGLAAEAERRRSAGELEGALGAWRQALALLPPESGQHGAVTQTIDALGKELAKRQARPALSPGLKKGLAGAGVVGLLLWKLKAVLLVLLTKGKLLLLGFGNAGTLFSVLAVLPMYWAVWGWQFAVGVLAALYVHEIGHVSAARRLGLPVSAPVFAPFGAFVLLKERPATPREDARLGLAGPLWGGLAACVALVVGKAGGFGLLVAIAHMAAWLNLLNLLPIQLLDGDRGFRALAKADRWWVAGGLVALYFLLAREPTLLILAAGAAFRAVVTEKSVPARPDRWALLYYLALAAFLATVMVLSAGSAVEARPS